MQVQAVLTTDIQMIWDLFFTEVNPGKASKHNKRKIKSINNRSFEVKKKTVLKQQMQYIVSNVQQVYAIVPFNIIFKRKTEVP